MFDYENFENIHDWSIRDIDLFKRILQYCSKYMLWILLSIVLSLIITAISLSLPMLIQVAIDSYVAVDSFSPQESIEGLDKIALWFGMLSGIGFLFGFMQKVLLEWIGQTVMQRLRQDLFRHLLGLDLNFYHNQPAGRLVTRLTNDIQNLHEMLTSVIIALFNEVLKLFGIFLVLYLMNVRLALVMSGFVPLAFVLIVLFARMARRKFRSIRSQLTKLNSFLSEALSGMTIIQAFNVQSVCKDRYYKLSHEYLRRTLSQIRLFGTFLPLIEFLSSAAVALILWFGGGQVVQSQLSLGELVAFLTYMRLFFQPLSELSQKYSIVQSAMASSERIFELLDTRASISPAESWVANSVLKGKVRFEAVSFGYNKQATVLRDINLVIQPGETVAIIGHTGSGKTTLISLLNRFYDPDSGAIYVDDKDIRQFALKQLRQIVGVIMQEIFLLPDTVLNNIILDMEYDARKLSAILKQTGVDSFIKKLPQGLDTIIGEGGLSLSVGEKQLLSFARVLYREPMVLVLDEATACIDLETEKMLEDAVAGGIENRTSIIIAHRLTTIRRANRIAIIDDGAIKELGTHEELMAEGAIYKQLVELDLYYNNAQQSGRKNADHKTLNGAKQRIMISDAN